MSMRPLTLHASALTDAEYKYFTTSFCNLAEIDDNDLYDDGYFNDLKIGGREVKAWLKGRYPHLPLIEVDRILKFFHPHPNVNDMLSGGQFFAILRLVLHIEGGKALDRSLVFVQVSSISNLAGGSLGEPMPTPSFAPSQPLATPSASRAPKRASLQHATASSVVRFQAQAASSSEEDEIVVSKRKRSTLGSGAPGGSNIVAAKTEGQGEGGPAAQEASFKQVLIENRSDSDSSDHEKCPKTLNPEDTIAEVPCVICEQSTEICILPPTSSKRKRHGRPACRRCQKLKIKCSLPSGRGEGDHVFWGTSEPRNVAGPLKRLRG